MAFPIIDSHIHLYAASHISSLNWTADLPKNHVLNRQNSVDEYNAATSSQADLRGFVFVETDRKSGPSQDEWNDALEEVAFLARISSGQPKSGEGHEAKDNGLMLGIVPWAPLPAGPAALTQYVELAKERFATNKWHLVKGFRYLVQDKPQGTMLQPEFIESLHWLGDQGFAFDLGVDAHSGGLHQLEEACEMMDRVFDAGNPLKIMINHFCKPNLRLNSRDALAGHPEFTQWKKCIERMASHKSTYMKLSGFFSELPPQTEDEPANIEHLLVHTRPWIDTVLAAYGSSRIMFGSDWPVCNMGGPGIQKSWKHWHRFVQAVLDEHKLSDEEKKSIWAGTAAEAYGISLS